MPGARTKMCKPIWSDAVDGERWHALTYDKARKKTIYLALTGGHTGKIELIESDDRTVLLIDETERQFIINMIRDYYKPSDQEPGGLDRGLDSLPL